MELEPSRFLTDDPNASRLDEVVLLVKDEACRATQLHGNFNSAHEAYGVLLEEVDEFWEHVRRKRQFRVKDDMRRELIQIAAVAIKAIVSLDL